MGRTSASLDWHLLERSGHAGVQQLVRDLNRTYRRRAVAARARLRSPRASAGSSRTTRTSNVSPSRASRAAGARSCASATSPAPLARATASRSRNRAGWREVLNTDATRVRRIAASATSGASSPRRRPWHDQPLLGRGDPPAARRRLARPGGVVSVPWPGRPFPLGATWDGSGTNFSLFSEHAERVELCLFDARRRRRHASRSTSERRTTGTATCRGWGRGSATATACTGRGRPSAATASTRRSS